MCCELSRVPYISMPASTWRSYFVFLQCFLPSSLSPYFGMKIRRQLHPTYTFFSCYKIVLSAKKVFTLGILPTVEKLPNLYSDGAIVSPKAIKKYSLGIRQCRDLLLRLKVINAIKRLNNVTNLSDGFYQGGYTSSRLIIEVEHLQLSQFSG